ncbi:MULTISPECIES: hypothetical protein [unclassified Nodularia (in: cyanobacteria)]|nr:hypothetical protein [Nodularia sp. LEGE 04288]MCC2694053.1 hypothetical protein [Nodularia sp. LEGE 04288]
MKAIQAIALPPAIAISHSGKLDIVITGVCSGSCVVFGLPLQMLGKAEN